MLFPWAANNRMGRGLAIHALRMAINLGLPAHKAAFKHGSRTALLVIRRSQKSFESNISKIVKFRPVRMWLLLRYVTDSMSEPVCVAKWGNGAPSQKCFFNPTFRNTRSGGPVSERLRLSRSIADRLLFKVKPVFVVRHCKTGAVAVMNYDKIRNDQRY